MKLLSCEFVDLELFGNLTLDDFRKVSTFVGPNGSGKSSIIKALHFSLTLLSKHVISDKIESDDAILKFKSVKLKFTYENDINILFLSDKLGEKTNYSEITISIKDNRFIISTIQTQENSISFSDEISTHADIIIKTNTVERLRKENKIDELSIWRNHLNDALKTIVTINNNQEHIQRSDADQLVGNLFNLETIFIPPQTSPKALINEYITEMIRLKIGKKTEKSKYESEEEKISHFLQSDIDFHSDGENNLLDINGIVHTKASTGTQISLNYYVLTRTENKNTFIFWDEPENGLHPTRRCRLLSLMLNDNRQFFIATHAPEMAPVTDKDGMTLRCLSKFDSHSREQNLLIESVSTRSEAFSAIEDLGVYPARTLFTSNIVIWVEGPTDLIFFRHWLKEKFKETDVQEGFHYTFMLYGGASIAHVEVEENPYFDSLFDLLSLCRNPVVIVDSDISDIRHKNLNKPETFLKKSALKIKNQIDILNNSRNNSGLFLWTKGREVENFLPKKAIIYAIENLCKSLTTEERKKLQGFNLPPYQRYFEAIDQYFQKEKIINNEGSSMGKSLWGEGNKVKFMKEALQMPDFVDSDLVNGADDLLSQLFLFINQHKNKHLV